MEDCLWLFSTISYGIGRRKVSETLRIISAEKSGIEVV